MAKDIFDDAADLFILDRGRTSESTRARLAEVFRVSVHRQIEEAARAIEIQTDRLNAAIRTGEADTVRFVVDSLIKLSARVGSLADRIH